MHRVVSDADARANRTTAASAFTLGNVRKACFAFQYRMNLEYNSHRQFGISQADLKVVDRNDANRRL